MLSRSRGVTFVRALCTAMLKRHAMGAKACGIVPRIRRELPVSCEHGNGWLLHIRHMKHTPRRRRHAVVG